MKSILNNLVTLCIVSIFIWSWLACQEIESTQDVWTAEELIAELVADDHIVDVDGDEVRMDGFPIVGIINLRVKTSSVIACDPFGWGEEYNWLCTMTGTKGRALGRAAAEPTVNDIGTFVQAGSEDYPGDITSITYYNANTYINQLDTVANPAAFFGLTIATFGPEWTEALEQWCFNDHIPMCIQE